jgi:hypothetical protein
MSRLDFKKNLPPARRTTAVRHQPEVLSYKLLTDVACAAQPISSQIWDISPHRREQLCLDGEDGNLAGQSATLGSVVLIKPKLSPNKRVQAVPDFSAPVFSDRLAVSLPPHEPRIPSAHPVPAANIAPE